VKSLLGAVPIEVAPTDLARDSKPQRYTSSLEGASVV
jgi:hypothetical protein